MDPIGWFQLFAPIVSTGAVATAAVALERLRNTRERVDKLEKLEREHLIDQVRAEERLRRISEAGRELTELEKNLAGQFEKISQSIAKLREESTANKDYLKSKIERTDRRVDLLDVTKRSKDSDQRFPAQGGGAESSGRFPAPRLPALDDTDPPPKGHGR